MSRSASTTAFREGLVAGMPFVLVVVPFAVLFGAVATEAGFDLAQTMGMSFLVIAGASQFTALQLMSENAPMVVVLAAALAVNMRMAMYSASIARHFSNATFWQRILAAYVLVDQTYGLSFDRFERKPPLDPSGKLAFYFGTASLICPLWYLATYAGAVAGQAIPPQFALDFAVPICFIAIFAPQLRSLPHLATALVSIVLALALAFIPYSGGLLIAAVLAMATGTWVEKLLERRA